MQVSYVKLFQISKNSLFFMILAVNSSKTPQSWKINPNFDNFFKMCIFLARGSLNFSKNGRNGLLGQFLSRKAIYLMYSYFWGPDNVPVDFQWGADWDIPEFTAPRRTSRRTTRSWRRHRLEDPRREVGPYRQNFDDIPLFYLFFFILDWPFFPDIVDFVGRRFSNCPPQRIPRDWRRRAGLLWTWDWQRQGGHLWAGCPDQGLEATDFWGNLIVFFSF